MSTNYDLIIVGGGLSGGLLAYRLHSLFPECRLLVLEKSDLLGGNHTWSFHSTDVSPEALFWLRPLITKSWDHHWVHFPERDRKLAGGYHSIRSEQFQTVISRALGDKIRFHSDVLNVTRNQVTLSDGEILSAVTVIDARGFFTSVPQNVPLKVGYQKFVGLDVWLKAPHGLKGPLLMDARVEQVEGYRFFYLLPWSATSLLIEDTRYSDSPDVTIEDYKTAILAYVKAQGWEIEEIERQEIGTLPIPLAAKRPPSPLIGALGIGTRAGGFHPTTGYSLPDAVKLADEIASIGRFDESSLRYLVDQHYRARFRGQRFYYYLNRMLFDGATGSERRRIMERFYGLPEPVIQRFYAAKLRYADVFRLLVGRPPIPVLKALTSLFHFGGSSFAESPV